MLDKIRLTLLGLWVGSAAFFSFIVAPVAFQVLPSQQLAGTLVSRTHGITEIIGVAIGLVLLSISLLNLSTEGGGDRKKPYVYDIAMAFLMTLSMLISKFVVSSRMHEIRGTIGDISTLTADNPNKITFDQLHNYSVWLMSFNLIIALILIVLTLIRSSSNASDA